MTELEMNLFSFSIFFGLVFSLLLGYIFGQVQSEKYTLRRVLMHGMPWAQKEYERMRKLNVGKWDITKGEK